MQYCYTIPDTGESITLSMSVAEMERRQVDGWITLDDGRRAKRDMGTEIAGAAHTHAWDRPLLSDAAGCHPSQRGEMQEYMASRGVPTEFNREGQAVFTSRGHRARALKALGMHDRNGGYSD